MRVPASPRTRSAAAPAGYATGRQRREQIVATAAAVYTEAGYDGASLREIAKRVGISHATLKYHFPSREALLAAVLERRDEQDAARVPSDADADADAVAEAGAGVGVADLAGLEYLLDLAVHNQRHPRIVELYVRLAAEAVPEGHPAHDYFTRHYDQARDAARSAFAALDAAGRLRPGVDPGAAAVTFIALMDGLQVQWLANPDRIDLVGPLRFLLRQLLAAAPDDRAQG